jgi:hypothetical protein
MRAKIFYVIAFLIIFTIFTNRTWSSEWGLRGLLPRGTGYYDKSSIKKINENIRQVWTVTIYSKEGKADAFSILKKQDKAPDNPEVLNQESTLLEFDCANGKYRIASINIYDEKEYLLLSVSDINDKWHDVIPNSINDKLQNIVCSIGDASKNEKK